MTRRLFGLIITLALGSFEPLLGTTAQPPQNVLRVGFLCVPTPFSLRYEEAFRPGLHRLSSVIGEHIAIEERSAPE